MRDSTIIYRSFYESIKGLPKTNQAEVWEAVFEYALNFKEVELKGISKSIFTLIKPQIDANNKRYISGTQPKKKRNGSETEAKDKQTTSEPQANVNDNLNGNENNNGKVNDYVEPKLFLLTKIEIDLEQMLMKSGLSKSDFFDCITQWSLKCVADGWIYSNDPSEDLRRLRAGFQKWLNTWTKNDKNKTNEGTKKIGRVNSDDLSNFLNRQTNGGSQGNNQEQDNGERF